MELDIKLCGAGKFKQSNKEILYPKYISYHISLEGNSSTVHTREAVSIS